jgi:AcrR family transcriptional regulator
VKRASRSGGAGRRSGDSGRREAILEAARQQFASHGYDKATIRGIAGGAGVDPALVYHYYGSKERLFAAAMRLPLIPSEMIAAIVGPAAEGGPRPDGPEGGAGLGERMVRTAVGVWDSEEVRDPFLGLLRSALTNENAAAMLREFITSTIIGTVAAAAPGRDDHGHDARYRASLAASQMAGLAVTRYLLTLEPVASATPDELAAAVGPVLQHYLTGDLGR